MQRANLGWHHGSFGEDGLALFDGIAAAIVFSRREPYE
jgi:hypothetical protein